MYGGHDAKELGGQVQFHERFLLKRLVGKRSYDFIGSGTLIDRKWVLTAGHCVSKNPFSRALTTSSGRVLVGDLRLGESKKSYKIKNIIKNENADLALIELEEKAPAEYVVRYSGAAPVTLPQAQAAGTDAPEYKIRGWGEMNAAEKPKDSGDLPDVLKEMTVLIFDDQSAAQNPEYGNRLQARDPGAAVGFGDSGSGWYNGDLIYAVTSTGGGEKFFKEMKHVYGVPTCDHVDWIKKNSLVQPG
ncbi:MAG: trypsin-like serine protease [Rubrobacteraceae bacterium]